MMYFSKAGKTEMCPTDTEHILTDCSNITEEYRIKVSAQSLWLDYNYSLRIKTFKSMYIYIFFLLDKSVHV